MYRIWQYYAHFSAALEISSLAAASCQWLQLVFAAGLVKKKNNQGNNVDVWAAMQQGPHFSGQRVMLLIFQAFSDLAGVKSFTYKPNCVPVSFLWMSGSP